MWNMLKGLFSGQQDRVDEDPDLQEAINASMGVTQPPASSTHRAQNNSSLSSSYDEDALLARAIAESKKEAAKPKKDTTLEELKNLCNAFQLDDAIIAGLEKNYSNYVKECPNNSASLKAIDFQKHLFAFNRLPEAQQLVLIVFVNETLSIMNDSFVNQFNFFLNFGDDPNKAFADLFEQIRKQQEKSPATDNAVAPQPQVSAVIIKPEEKPENEDLNADPDLAAAIALSKQTDSAEISISVKDVKSMHAQKSKALAEKVDVQAQPTSPVRSAPAEPTLQADQMRLRRILTLGKKIDDVKGAIDLLLTYSSSYKEQIALLDAYDKTTNERTLAGLSAFMATSQQDNTVTPIQDLKKQKMEEPTLAVVPPVAQVSAERSLPETAQNKPLRRSSRKKE